MSETLTIGSLCSGIPVGGLEMGVERALNCRVAFQAEVDPHASTVLAAHWPGVPNLGDLRTVDWAVVEPVDVMCFGFPCQDISSAGRRAGLGGEKSALWFDCADAVRVVRPRYLLVENVGALLVRGLGRVLGDLAAMGYVGRWGCLRSSHVGAPHRRERIFIAAAADSDGRGCGSRGVAGVGGSMGRWREDPRDAATTPHAGAAATDPRGAGAGREPGGLPRAATSARRTGTGVRAFGDGGAAPPDPDDERRPGTGSTWRRGARPADSGDAAAYPDGQRLAGREEPDVGTEAGVEASRRRDPDGRGDAAWGTYTAAVRGWEAIHGPAPAPRDDRGRLNPELPEWMLGLPPGWVTDLPIPRTAQLRVLGNAVQPQVAELAARLLLLPLLARDLREAG